MWGGGGQCLSLDQAEKRPSPSWRPPLLHRLNIDQNNPESGVIIFPACHYGARVVTCTAWQIYISVITHGERDPYSCGSSFYIKVASILTAKAGHLSARLLINT